MQELIDILSDTSPYSQLLVAGGILTAYIATIYAQDRLTEEKEEEMGFYEAKAWLEGREEEYQNRWENFEQNPSNDNENENMSYEEAKALLEDE